MMNSITLTRREMLQCSVAAALTLPASGAGAGQSSPVTATGVVRADGAGLGGVLVTNGRDIVSTDEDGRYAISCNGDAIISVIKPTGYAVPLDPETNLARFYRIHQPLGTPPELDLSGPGIAPTGPLPESLDFHLTRADEPTRFDAILLADPQPETHAEVNFIRDGLLPAIGATKAAFGITLGDITGDNHALYPRINALIGQIGAPWYSAIGNHDLNYEAPDDRYARETFKRTFGPTHYAFEYGGALFIVLDNIVYHGADPAQPEQMGDYHDALDSIQLQFVANVLKHTPADQLVVLSMHIPLKSRRDSSGRHIAIADTAELLRIIGDRRCVSYSGHTHMSETRYILPDADAPERSAHRHQVLATVCGSWWSGPFDERGVALADCCDGSPAGYYILSVDGARCATQFRPTHGARGRGLRIVLSERANEVGEARRLLGPALTREQIPHADIIVNIFEGGPRTSVSCSISNRPPFAMRQKSQPDPFVAAEYRRNGDVIKPWVKAVNTGHLWVAPMPTDLADGVHRIDVASVSDSGATHHASVIVEIVAERSAFALSSAVGLSPAVVSH